MSIDLVRPAAVAGQFYPADAAELRLQVTDFLDRAPDANIGGPVQGMVVPHAGYAYSGQVAASAYRQIRGEAFDAAVLIAPSHRERCGGASVFAGSAYRTPLGELPVHQDIAEQIADTPGVVRSTIGHGVQEPGFAGLRGEHAIEVHLPFLQVAIGTPPIVPLVMDSHDPDICGRLADAIVEAARTRKLLIVASSDLCHTDDYDACRASDDRTLDSILSGDPSGFLNDVERGRAQVCGAGPITTAMIACAALGADQAVEVSRLNSDDAVGRRGGYVVGYGAVVFCKRQTGGSTGEITDKASVVLSADDRTALGRIARAAIQRTVTNSVEPTPEPTQESPALRMPSGAFVTLRRDGKLRACVGDIHGREALAETVRQMAAAAATRDPRFSPIDSSELETLDAEISVISPLQPLATPTDIEIGQHGLLVRKGLRSGVLLPYVAADQGWDRIEFLRQTCGKASLSPGAWQDPRTEVFTFTADVFPA